MSDQIELLRVLEELERRKKECPIAAFKPHPGQNSVLLVIDNVPITIVLAGNRFGKTHFGVEELICSSLGYRPWQVPNFHLLKDDANKMGWNFPPRDMIPYEAWVKRADGLPIAVPNHLIFVTGLDLSRGIGEVVQEKFSSLWPMDRVHFEAFMYKLGTWRKLVMPNKSEITFASAQQDRMAFEAFAADGAFFDEPCPRNVYTSVKRGLVDKKGKLLWTLTPLGDSDIAWMAADLLSGTRKDVQVIHGRGMDNPYIDRDALQAFLDDAALTDAERRARDGGEVGTIGKRIVSTFDPGIVVIPPTDIPRDVPRMLVVDPHHARSPCCIWLAVLDDGERFIAYREWPTDDVEKIGAKGISNHDFAGLIKSLEGREDVRWRVCDPKFGVAHAKVHGEQFESFVEVMGRYNLHFDSRTDNDIDRGIQKLRDAFRPSNITQKPRLLIMSHMRNTINSMSLWSYKELEGGRLKVDEPYKDFADCLRYALMYDLPLLTNEDGCYSYLEDDETKDD